MAFACVGSVAIEQEMEKLAEKRCSKQTIFSNDLPASHKNLSLSFDSGRAKSFRRF